MPKDVPQLKDTKIKHAKPKEKEYNLADGEGLMLRVYPSGSKRWYFNYKNPHTGKRNSMCLGSYPSIGSQKARIIKAEYDKVLADGENPKDYRDKKAQATQKKHINTFKVVMAQWMASRENKVSEAHQAKMKRLLELYIIPKVGGKPISKIEAQDFIHALRPLEEQGKLETVKKAIHNINGIMNYAVNYGLIKHNPAQNIKEVFQRPNRTHMATIKPDELPDLMRALSKANIKHQTRCLIEWQLHTMTRPNEAVGAKWSEIDFKQKLWAIPAERMKGRKEKKREHLVPLTEQTLGLLDFMRPISGNRDHIFPNDHNPRKPMSSQTVNMALKRMGFQGRLVSHGLRALASTTLNEQGFNGDVIEACLAHVDKNEVRKAYNRSHYLEQRVKVMAWWSEHIENASQGNLSLTGAKGLRVVK